MSDAAKSAWDAFMDGNGEPEGVRDDILEAWERCKSAGVDPGVATLPQVSADDLKRRRTETQGLLDAVSPGLEALVKHLKDSRVLACLLDNQGCLLRAFGQPGPDIEIVTQHFLPGLLLREVLCGCTAFSMAAASGRLASCVGPEHYCVQFHEIAEVALPVRDESANPLGTLLLVGRAGQISVATLSLLGRSCLRLAKAQQQTRHLHDYAQVHAHILAGMMSTASNPVVLVGPKGYLRSISPAGIRMLQFDLSQDLNRPLDQVARFEPPILGSLCTGRELHGVPVEVHAPARSFTVRVDAFPLRDTAGGLLGTMLTFREDRPIGRQRRREGGQTARYTFQDLIGKSEHIARAKQMAGIAARTSVSVLLEGPSGTGKEMFAQAVHNGSDRRNGPFVSVNCAAIPAELIESELFGYEEGAFTGARRGGMIGKFEAASGGTIFLDEIGDMPLAVQAECLRVLENRSIVRVGQHDEIAVDIRVIAATNKRLVEEIEAGRFREDLYYRLGVFRITLRRLQESVSDIPTLVEDFIERYNHEMSRSVAGLGEGVLERFMSYEWPGNIRELKNAIEHAVTVDSDSVIGLDDLPDELRESLLLQSNVVDASDPLVDQKKGMERLERDLAEGARDLYLGALRQTGGNVKRAAAVVGVSRATFYRKMAGLGITRKDL